LALSFFRHNRIRDYYVQMVNSCRLVLRYINAVFAGVLPKDKLVMTADLEICAELQLQIIARGDSGSLSALRSAEQYNHSGGPQDRTQKASADIYARATSAFCRSSNKGASPPLSWQAVLEKLVAVAAGKERMDIRQIYELLLGAPDPRTGQAYDSAFVASSSFYLSKVPHGQKVLGPRLEHMWLPAALAMLRLKQAMVSVAAVTEDIMGGLSEDKFLRCGNVCGH
jgi:hypothetical protein